jgi:hypothetical protein
MQHLERYCRQHAVHLPRVHSAHSAFPIPPGGEATPELQRTAHRLNSESAANWNAKILQLEKRL